MKRLYNVEVRLSSGSWHAHLSCQCVGLERARGIVTGIGLAYPCPDRRIVERETGRLVEAWPGHGAVTTTGL